MRGRIDPDRALPLNASRHLPPSTCRQTPRPPCRDARTLRQRHLRDAGAIPSRVLQSKCSRRHLRTREDRSAGRLIHAQWSESADTATSTTAVSGEEDADAPEGPSEAPAASAQERPLRRKGSSLVRAQRPSRPTTRPPPPSGKSSLERAAPHPRALQYPFALFNYIPRVRILSKKELRALVRYSPAHIDRLEKAGLFPKAHLGPCLVGRIESEALDWLQRRNDLRDGGSRSKKGPSAFHNSSDH